MALTRIKTNNILDRQVTANDLAEGSVTLTKILVPDPPLPGFVLTTDGAGSLEWTSPTGTPIALNTLTDVNTAGALNGDSLVFNSTTGEWAPGSNVPSSIGLNSLVDVTITGVPSSNQFLRHDGSQFRNVQLTAAMVQNLALVGLTGAFGDLVDVDLVPGPTLGQTIRWVGDRWVPGDLADLGSIDNFADVDLTGIVTNDVLQWNGTQFVPVDIGAPPVVSSNTFVVNDIASRDLISPDIGDQAYVRVGNSGEWELYLWDSAWVLIATEDSSTSDANTSEAIVLFNTGSPVLIGNVSDGSRITNITIEVTTVFDGVPTLSVGDDGDNARLIDDSLFDLSSVGTYVCDADYIYDGTEVPGTLDTDIMAYFDFTGSTQGEIRIIVTHV